MVFPAEDRTRDLRVSLVYCSNISTAL